MITGNRSSGILLHVTSLPSKFGIGDLGPEAHRFVDLSARLKQNWWSILPLNPTSQEHGNSPYRAHSGFAGNPLLVSPELLIEDGLLSKERVKRTEIGSSYAVNYVSAQTRKNIILSNAYSRFRKWATRSAPSEFEFDNFCSEEANWLDDYALYAALREGSSKPWCDWPDSLRNRERLAMKRKKESLKEVIQKKKFAQYVFFSQWHRLKSHCKRKGVKVVGDLSFYLDYDSVDVWAHPELFKLDKHKKLEYVGGVPPDYFSKTGQLWETPVYQWRQHRKTRFEWWLNRVKHSLKLFDALRLDHFRGFVAYWQIPAVNRTAKKGRWIRAPSENFFEMLKSSFPKLPFIAEDLGFITQPVRDAIRGLGIPGMKVLLFAFGGAKNDPNLPSNYSENSVAYTGTHDTNTVRGWFKEEATAQEKERVFNFIGHKVTENEISIEFLRIVLAAKANLSIVPIQDALGLGAEARMNHPRMRMGNWEWRATKEQLSCNRLAKFGELTAEHNR